MKPEPHNMKVEDEEDLLYGESGSSFKMKNVSPTDFLMKLHCRNLRIIFCFQLADLALPSNAKKTDWWKRQIQPKKPSFWLFVIRDNGNMEIYFMPDMKLAYIVNNVGEGNRYLSDSMEFVPLMLNQNGDTDMDGSSYQTCSMATMPTEIFIAGLGSHGRRPMLFIRTKVDLLVYQVIFVLVVTSFGDFSSCIFTNDRKF